jgi:hypothetical protein
VAVQGEHTASRRFFLSDEIRYYVFTAPGTYNQNVSAASNLKLIPVRSDKGENFIVKDMIPGEFEYQQDLQKSIAPCPNLRTVIDTIPDFELFVYHFLAIDLLQFSQKNVSEETRRNILRSALTGLADLHDRGIIHTGQS